MGEHFLPMIGFLKYSLGLCVSYANRKREIHQARVSFNFTAGSNLCSTHLLLQMPLLAPTNEVTIPPTNSYLPPKKMLPPPNKGTTIAFSDEWGKGACCQGGYHQQNHNHRQKMFLRCHISNEQLRNCCQQTKQILPTEPAHMKE